MISKKEYFSVIVLIIGITLSTLSMHRFLDTIINFKVVFVVWVMIGIISSLSWSLFFESGISLLRILSRVIIFAPIFGGILVYSFLLINRTFGINGSEKVIHEQVINKSVEQSRLGKSFPVVLVKVEGIKKQLNFKSGTLMDEFKSVDLTVKKGYFGYYIILKKELKQF